MRHFLAVLMSLAVVNVLAAPPPAGLFDDKPYTIDVATIQRLDPKPLEFQVMQPDPSAPEKIKGVRILSKGRIFPFSYQVISVAGSAPDVLDAMSASFEGHSDIVLKEFVACRFAQRCLHWFEEDNVNGKPHHVSSDYAFIKDGVMYHMSATSYAPVATGKPAWAVPPKPDTNAQGEAQTLMGAMSLK